jgi:hypothetical protein
MKTGNELSEFLQNKMSMTANYQPVIIRELLRNNGNASVDELLKALMLENQDLLTYWRTILMRWPKITLMKHDLVSYDRRAKRFSLLVDLKNTDQTAELIRFCDEKINQFNSPVVRRQASVRWQVIEQRAKGRCEACGVLARVKPLDIDHIVPRAVAERNRGIWHGKVPDRHGNMIDVDDFNNLQILCTTCNGGKRDQGVFHDFRPSNDSLVEAIKGILLTAEEITQNEPTKRDELFQLLKNCF